MDSKAIARLFERFSIIWGNKWDSYLEKNPEPIADEWMKALTGQSRQAIQQGLSKTRQQLTWPPTIAEFLQACQGAQTAINPNQHSCAVGGCPDTGTMCRNPFSSTWICIRHWREGKG